MYIISTQQQQHPNPHPPLFHVTSSSSPHVGWRLRTCRCTAWKARWVCFGRGKKSVGKLGKMVGWLLYIPGVFWDFWTINNFSGDGFKDFFCSPLLMEIIQFDEHIFQMGCNHLGCSCRKLCWRTGIWLISHQTKRWSNLPFQHCQAWRLQRSRGRTKRWWKDSRKSKNI